MQSHQQIELLPQLQQLSGSRPCNRDKWMLSHQQIELLPQLQQQRVGFAIPRLYIGQRLANAAHGLKGGKNALLDFGLAPKEIFCLAPQAVSLALKRGIVAAQRVGKRWCRSARLAMLRRGVALG
ncbi:hypothetical protein DIPPA_31711 [Diplonema papillatum]|nr:hypothetical protein DIPPA_31711 [Diplonema papillatum]